MMIKTNDENQRSRALDTTHSFIVQAPAGSGKTELLTQRFLALLQQVKKPEEILAITFTKKSAAEMRARIISALNNAHLNPEPEIPHAKKTWGLAKQALNRNQELNWNLLDNPNQLRIQTIDSLNASLTKQLPILSHFGAAPDITDDPVPLYREAIQEFLSHIEENVSWSQDIAQLLFHLDNNLNKVEDLLINMLQKRDQWLPYINLESNHAILRKKLESYLAIIHSDALNNVIINFPENLKNSTIDWINLPEQLLTKEFTWRKRHPLANQLNEHENLRQALKELALAPHPHYQETQWQTLQALHKILHVAVAQLKLVFQQYGKIDYIENAQAALTALGTEESPTDIALILDYQIKHILVDEFQDTSNNQYRLLQKLTAGWEPHDGRTLFVVGDPMQSIYRFREAEVGLFIRARKKGIGNIILEPLTLSTNFRSVPGIVEWVNTHFESVFPAYEDIATGAVSYSKSTANQVTDEQQDSAVMLHPLDRADTNTQAELIIQLIQKTKQNNPNNSIAILVRSRTHLASIIPALKSENLPYRAIDIDSLTIRSAIQDMMALTRALLYPADRTAWLAILRAPWCGLSLSDLFILSNQYPNNNLLEQLECDTIINTLSPEGQHQLSRVLPILKTQLAECRRTSLRAWIEQTWLLLGGPAALQQPSDLDDVQAFLTLLDTLDEGGDLINLENLNRRIKKLFANPNNQADNTLQIMTIHNAKGLEFDTVILPHLERKASQDDKQLMHWMERPLLRENSVFVLAPINATGEKEDPIYDYVKRQHAIKSKHETGRLLYVAATRAKKELHLLFTAPEPEKKPTPNSLLEQLWRSPLISHLSCHLSCQRRLASSDKNEEFQDAKNKTITRLSPNWTHPIPKNESENTVAYHQKKFNFQLPDNNPKIIGIVIHKILEQLCNLGTSWWKIETSNQYIQQQLVQLGMPQKNIPDAISQIQTAIKNTLLDTRGQWIIASHQDAKSEFAITAIIDNTIKSLIIDRTFVDDTGIRWIIDYKTSTTPDENKEQYKLQLQHYSQAMRGLDNRPIRLGLYFPMLPAWQEWSAT